MSYVDARTIQKGLTVLQYQPGPVDGVMGDTTRKALNAWITSLPGSPSVVPAGCRRTATTTLCEGATIEPDSAADLLTAAATRYATPATQRERAHQITSPSEPLPTLPLPFFRVDNPWAWVAGSGALLIVGGVALMLTSKPRRRR